MSPTEFLRRYEAATCAHDLEGTLNLIAEDAIFLFSDCTSHVGKSAVGKVLAANFEAIRDETYRLENLHWVARSDDVAVCVYEYRWSGVIEGEIKSGRGRGTSVLRRENEAWLVAHEHLSPGGI